MRPRSTSSHSGSSRSWKLMFMPITAPATGNISVGTPHARFRRHWGRPLLPREKRAVLDFDQFNRDLPPATNELSRQMIDPAPALTVLIRRCPTGRIIRASELLRHSDRPRSLSAGSHRMARLVVPFSNWPYWRCLSEAPFLWC